MTDKNIIGKTISHYKILEKIGEGGMGIVYKAHDMRLNRPVALKFLAPSLTRDTDKKQRFLREAQTVSSFDHPNIAVVHDIDESEDGRSFISMAYYDGDTLKDRIEHQTLDSKTIIKIGKDILTGLQQAHNAGIVHRDVKPGNIIITKQQEVKILDFGLAKLSDPDAISRSGLVVGTALYMSPEQISGKEVDHRSDLFSFGILLYEMATGKHPFMEEHQAALFYSIVNTDPTPPSKLRSDIPEALERIILKLLEKDPEQRYQSAGEALHALEMLYSSSAGFQPQPFIRRETTSVVAVSGFLLLLVLLFFSPVREAGLHVLGVSSLPEEKRIAVLPFTNIGGDPEHQSFSDGLTEMMASTITEMDMYQSVFWVVPTREVRYAGIESAAQAKRALGATLVLDGSVYRSDEIIRITLNLIDAGSLRQLRSITIEDSVDNLAGLQRGAIRRVSSMLELELRPEEYRLLTAGETESSAAYDHYIQGIGLLQRFELLENVNSAIEQFSRAIDKDPMFARSYAKLGEAFWRKFELTNDSKWIDRAIEQSNRAIAIDDRLPAVYVTLGMIHSGKGQYDEALNYLTNALKYDHTNADAYREIAGVYAAMGDTKRAEGTYRMALELRPGSWVIYNELGKFYLRQGRFDDAEQQFKRVIDVTPDNPLGYNNLGAVYNYTGRRDEAREQFEKSIAVIPTDIALSNLGTIRYFEEEFEEAVRLYEKLLDLDDGQHQHWGFLAAAYNQVGAGRDTVNELYKQAALIAEKQKEINPQNPEVLCDLAGYYTELGYHSRAQELLDKVFTIAPHNVMILGRMGEIYESLGERERALEMIESALKGGYPVDEIQRIPDLKDLRNDPRFSEIVAPYNN